MPFQKGQAGPGATKGKPHDKTILKIQTVLRLEMQNLGLTEAQLADHIGLKLGSYKMLKKTKIYKSLRSQYQTGIFTSIDESINSSYERQRKILDIAVPTALENLYAAAIQKLDKKLQFDASKEILDRHGIHAKVSRTGIALPDQGGIATAENNEIASELIKNAQRASIKAKEDKEALDRALNNNLTPPPDINDAPATDVLQ